MIKDAAFLIKIFGSIGKQNDTITTSQPNMQTCRPLEVRYALNNELNLSINKSVSIFLLYILNQ